MSWGYPYYLGAEKWFLSVIPPFVDEIVSNPPLHWYIKLQRLGLEYQQFEPNLPYPKVFGAWSQFKVQMLEDLVNWPPFGTVKGRTPIDEDSIGLPSQALGYKPWATFIKVNMRYFPEGEYVVPGLPQDMYAEIEAQRPQREQDLGRKLPRVVPHARQQSWKRPVLMPRSLGAASVVPFPRTTQWGASEDETEITWINQNWYQYSKPPKKQRPLTPSGNPDLFA
jgi:hypothetical protein